jgi:hypothetical protein
VSSPPKLLRPIWSLATIAAIVGLLLGVMAPVTSLVMAVPVFTGHLPRDAVMLGFMALPLLQVALMVVGTIREDSRPQLAMKLYAATIALLAVLLTIPAFW